MSTLLYRLEDHFDELADRSEGYLVGWLSLVLRGFFALVGDVVRPAN